MRTIGLLCPPIPGHLNPTLVLGEELRRRGHRVCVLAVADAAAQVRARGLELAELGHSDFPLGTLPAWQQSLQNRGGLASVLLSDA